MDRISLSEVIFLHGVKESSVHPATKVSQRLVRYVFKFGSMNGGKLLTAYLIFSSEAIISCLCRSSRDTVSFSLLSGGLSLKKAAFVHPCGVSLTPCSIRSCFAGNLCCGHTVYWTGW